MLRVLTWHRVEFIVVGWVSAVLHGAPVTTFDLDVVHARSQPARQLRPGESHLKGPGHQLLLTRFGAWMCST